MLEHFEFELKPAPNAERAYYFVFRQQRLLWSEQAPKLTALSPNQLQRLGLAQQATHFFGAYRGLPCYALEAAEDYQVPAGYDWLGLRQFVMDLDASVGVLAGRAKQILDFAHTHRFCGRCGAATQVHSHDLARRCDRCELSYYPRIAPCIIVLISRGDEVLLARGPRHPEGWYSTLAGFIEPGENIEQAVHREIAEEVGLKVHQLEYRGSQSWPFPHQLMIGFHASHLEGEINIDNDEIVEAHWWPIDELPPHPPASTISGQLVTDYIAEYRRSAGQGQG